MVIYLISGCTAIILSYHPTSTGIHETFNKTNRFFNLTKANMLICFNLAKSNPLLYFIDSSLLYILKLLSIMTYCSCNYLLCTNVNKSDLVELCLVDEQL